MFQRAVDLGLPASFVELRHEATHRELPSLVVLRDAAQRSLSWLWGYYWAKIPPFDGAGRIIDTRNNVPLPNDDELLLDTREAIRDMLSGADEEEDNKRNRDREPVRKKRRQVSTQRQYRQSCIAARLASVCRKSSLSPIVLSKMLLENSILIPAGRK